MSRLLKRKEQEKHKAFLYNLSQLGSGELLEAGWLGFLVYFAELFSCEALNKSVYF